MRRSVLAPPAGIEVARVYAGWRRACLFGVAAREMLADAMEVLALRVALR